MAANRDPIRYEGFLSYARADARVAKWLHRALERFRIPRELGAAEREPAHRFRPFFRDQDELGSSTDLSAALREAIEASANLIVLCSPAAAASRWVDEEVRAFQRLGRGDRIVCVLTAGDPNDPQSVFPPALREGVVPLAVDLRAFPRDRRTALLKLVSALLVVPYDRLRQRHRQGLRRRVAYSATAAVAVAVGVAVITYDVATEPPCTGSAARFAEVWNADARTAIETRFAASPLPFATDSWQRVDAALTRYGAEWVDTHTEACAATRVREEQSERLMDLRMACLDERRLAFATLAESLREADADVLEQAVEAAGSLPGLARCSNRTQLEAAYPLPDDGAARERIAAAQSTAIEASTLLATGRVDAATQLLETTEAALSTLDFPPVEAELLILRGTAEARRGASETARSTFYEATSKAVLSRDSELIARAWLALSRVLVDFRARVDEAFEVLGVTESYLAPLADDHPLRASFHHLRGTAMLRVSRLDEGYADTSRAVELARATQAPALDEYLLAMSWALASRSEIEEAGDLVAEAIELTRATVGEQHPTFASALIEAARVEQMTGNTAAASRLLEEAVSILEATYPQGNPTVVFALDQLGWALKDNGRYADAIDTLERALLMESTFETPRLRMLASLHNGLGDIHVSLSDFELAEAHMQQALEAWTASGPGVAIGVGLNNLGNLFNRTGDHRAAEDYCRRALDNDSAFVDADHPQLAFPLTCLGEALLGQQRASEALAPLARAEAIRNRPDLNPAALAWTRWLYGRALVESGQDTDRGLGFVQTSRRVFTEMGNAAESELSDIEAWLAAHRP